MLSAPATLLRSVNRLLAMCVHRRIVHKCVDMGVVGVVCGMAVYCSKDRMWSVCGNTRSGNAIKLEPF
jgi:hypothetical protein